ncbi:transcriptional regulator, partial [Bacillus sp. AFS075960]
MRGVSSRHVTRLDLTGYRLFLSNTGSSLYFADTYHR